MAFQRLSILGVGLLGGSIGLALKSSSSACKIMGYGHRTQSLEQALAAGAVDETTTHLAKAVADADLVVLCTPVGTFQAILTEIAPALRPGAIVTDVGSTKRTVCRLARQVLPDGVHFIGSHPMAGSEKRGVEAAKSDLFQGALCITTPDAQSNPDALRKVESFWQSLGMRITRLNPEEHDRLLADVSHLPHALAALLVLLQPDQALPLAGRGFLDSTRIAAGDPGLWRDILLDNSDNLRDGLRRMRVHLDRLESLLADSSKANELFQWLASAAQKRQAKSDSSPPGE